MEFKQNLIKRKFFHINMLDHEGATVANTMCDLIVGIFDILISHIIMMLIWGLNTKIVSWQDLRLRSNIQYCWCVRIRQRGLPKISEFSEKRRITAWKTYGLGTRWEEPMTMGTLLVDQSAVKCFRRIFDSIWGIACGGSTSPSFNNRTHI